MYFKSVLLWRKVVLAVPFCFCLFSAEFCCPDTVARFEISRPGKELPVSLFSTFFNSTHFTFWSHTSLCPHNSRVMQRWCLIERDSQYLLKMHIKLQPQPFVKCAKCLYSQHRAVLGNVGIDLFDDWFQTDGAPFPKRTNGKIKALIWSQMVFSLLGICGASNE